MKKISIRITAALLMLTMLLVSLPISALAAGLEQAGDALKQLNAEPLSADLGFIELSDGYVTVKVSKANGGYYVGTGEGDVITKGDDNADLTFADGEFDTSFTSFRITRNGESKDYIFGRDYSRLGIETSDTVVYKSADNAVVAEWTVDGVLIKQTIALMGEDSYQHGMAYIAYSATNTSDRPVDHIEARVMMDTALGSVDYAYYMLAQNDGSYVAVEEERTVSGSDYSNYFFAYDSKTSPNTTAYTLNASVEGESLAPKKVTFAHWANLASTVFDYTPSATAPLNFTKPLDSVDHLTADSAVALYYDLGGAPAEAAGGTVGLYYGVYSNYNAGDADVSLNFTSSGAMFFEEDGMTYKDQNGDLPGNFSTTLRIQNITDNTIDKLAVAIYPEEELYPHNGSSFVTDYSATNPYYQTITELKAKEGRDVRFDFRIDPTLATGYRRIKIVVYNTTAQSTLGDENTILEEEMFVLCPGAESAEIGFTGMTPASIFMKGKRFAYITGTNFGLIRDKSQYRILLRPLDGGDDVVLDQDKVVINPEKNTATLVLDMELTPTAYEVIIDWNDVSIDDMTSDALRLLVTDIPSPGDPGYVSSGVYGIVTIERNGTSYDIVNYDSEQAFQNTETKPQDIMLVLRGDFNVLSSEEQGRFKAEGVTLMDGDILNISEALDVKNGRVTVTKNFDENGNQTDISVDIEGKVYTTKANTKVWEGVLAITSFEEGKLFTLPVYNEQGDLSYTKGEEKGEIITLLWPGAASGAQTLLGLLLSFRYGQFALMKQGTEMARVIAFGASLDPSLLVPGGQVGTMAHYSKLEKQQMEMGVGGYTAAQLRANDTKFRKDQAEWRAEQRGTLNLYMDHILFGAGGFIGFNTTIDVGIPSYAEGLPYIQGTLALKIINDYWEFGVEGSADMKIFEMEATLKFKSYLGVPIPDEIYFFIGGVKPGIPVDPFGVFWIRGLGAGVSNIYETFFGRQSVPPITLALSGEFAVFAVLSARADVTISPQAFSLELSKVNIAGITLIDRIGGSVRWYPYFGISFGMRVDILDCIIGEGSLVARETSDGFYFCGYVSATIKIPDKIWFIGGKTIGSASVGVDTDKVWGSVKVIGIGVGVKYYWGGGVDIDLGKSYNVPKPEGVSFISDVPLCRDPNTGEVLFLSVTNDLTLLASSDLSETVITSSESGQYHAFALDPAAGQDGLLVLTYSAANELMAKDYRDMLRVSVEGEAYGLEWYNDAYSADHVANVGTNAIYQYDAESGTATVTISFTDGDCFGKVIEVNSEAGTTANLFGIERVADLTDITVSDGLDAVTVKGSKLNSLSMLNVYAEDESGSLYLLGEADVATLGESEGVIPVAVPQNMQTGKYMIKAIGTLCNEQGEEIASPMIERELEYVNSAQPTAPTKAELALSGNYTMTLNTDGNDTYDGYLASVYEVTENGYEDTIFTEIVAELDGTSMSRAILLGGRYASTNENGVVTYAGLEAGKKYAVSVQGFVVTEDGSRLLSTPIVSNEVMMVMPVNTTPVFAIEGAVKVEVGITGTMVDTVNKSSFTVSIGGVGTLQSGYYKLGNGKTASIENGEVVVTEQTFDWNGGSIDFSNMEDGSYYLTVGGVNATFDEFSAQYMFTVDTEAPGILVSSPQGGGFFSGSSVTVTGITEANARIEIGVADGGTTVLYADDEGRFSGEARLDETLAYQDLLIYAVDAAGNRSMPFGCTLTNDLLGNEDLKAVILYRGREVTEIVSGMDEKQLSMAFKSEGKYVTLNEGSEAASRIAWSVQVINGKSAGVSPTGLFAGDAGTEGVILATLDSKTAMATLVPVDLATAAVMLEIAAEGITYDGTEQKPTVKVLRDGATVTEGIDFTVSYLNNVDVGTASAIITATENGNCIGARIVTFEIKACRISAAEITLTEGEEKEYPTATLTYNGMTLEQDKDYTITYTISEDGKQGIVTVTGMGNYAGMASKTYEIKTFDHWTWLIPTITLAVLGGAVLAVWLIRRKRKGSTPEKKEPLPETEKPEADTPETPEAETPAVDEVPEQPKDGGEGEENKA